MAVLADPNGTVWSIDRLLWPFPGDSLDLTFGLFEVLTVERDGHQVGREHMVI